MYYICIVCSNSASHERSRTIPNGPERSRRFSCETVKGTDSAEVLGNSIGEPHITLRERRQRGHERNLWLRLVKIQVQQHKKMMKLCETIWQLRLWLIICLTLLLQGAIHKYSALARGCMIQLRTSQDKSPLELYCATLTWRYPKYAKVR